MASDAEGQIARYKDKLVQLNSRLIRGITGRIAIDIVQLKATAVDVENSLDDIGEPAFLNLNLTLRL